MEKGNRNEYMREYRAKNKETLKKYYEWWYQENKDRYAGYHQKYMENPENREKINEARRKRYWNNVEKERELNRIRQAKYQAKKKAQKEVLL